MIILLIFKPSELTDYILKKEKLLLLIILFII